jgi:hypothetical protein
MCAHQNKPFLSPFQYTLANAWWPVYLLTFLVARTLASYKSYSPTISWVWNLKNSFHLVAPNSFKTLTWLAVMSHSGNNMQSSILACTKILIQEPHQQVSFGASTAEVVSNWLHPLLYTPRTMKIRTWFDSLFYSPQNLQYSQASDSNGHPLWLTFQQTRDNRTNLCQIPLVWLLTSLKWITVYSFLMNDHVPSQARELIRTETCLKVSIPRSVWPYLHFITSLTSVTDTLYAVWGLKALTRAC